MILIYIQLEITAVLLAAPFDILISIIVTIITAVKTRIWFLKKARIWAREIHTGPMECTFLIQSISAEHCKNASVFSRDGSNVISIAG